jgi:DNA polymerase III epsilon subunit-like protein
MHPSALVLPFDDEARIGRHSPDRMRTNLQPKTNQRPDIAFVDLETSGLKPWEHEIIEIAAVRVDGKTLEIKSQTSTKVKPKGPVSPDAARINGYTPEKWKDAIAIEHGLKLLYPQIEGARWAGSNPSFDRQFVANANKKAGLEFPRLSTFRMIDTNAMVEPWIFHGIIPHAGLDELIKLFGLPPRGEHSALGDALLALEVYKRIVERFDVGRWRPSRGGDTTFSQIGNQGPIDG